MELNYKIFFIILGMLFFSFFGRVVAQTYPTDCSPPGNLCPYDVWVRVGEVPISKPNFNSGDIKEYPSQDCDGDIDLDVGGVTMRFSGSVSPLVSTLIGYLNGRQTYKSTCTVSVTFTQEDYKKAAEVLKDSACANAVNTAKNSMGVGLATAVSQANLDNFCREHSHAYNQCIWKKIGNNPVSPDSNYKCNVVDGYTGGTKVAIVCAKVYCVLIGEPANTGSSGD